MSQTNEILFISLFFCYLLCFLVDSDFSTTSQLPSTVNLLKANEVEFNKSIGKFQVIIIIYSFFSFFY